MPTQRGAFGSAFRFVLIMGIVKLIADMTYEGGASINFASNGRPRRPLMGVAEIRTTYS
jgi:hypothetical protein